MIERGFTSLQDIYYLANNKKIVFFGAGSVAKKTKRKLLDFNLSYIIDNNPNYWNGESMGLKIFNPNIIKTNKFKRNKHFIIICTTSFSSVVKQLISYGLESGKDFIVSPLMNDLRIIHQLENLQKKFLFTSGLPAEKSKDFGGGIYELDLKKDKWQYKKIYSGTCYGVIKNKNKFIAVDDKKGLISFGKDYKITKSQNLQIGTRAHGIAYSEKFKQYFVVASMLDKILIFDTNFKYLDEISISNKYEQNKDVAHHCNDICIAGDSLYVSMFSYSGNFQNDIFDGVVLEIDINTKEVFRPVISDLWMPHNISYIGGNITVLDSLRGGLRQNNAQEIGIFPGFTRGLDFDGTFFYIGQSRNRNFSKTFGISKNISIDTSIIIFDPITKVSRSIFLPSKVSEIHSVLLI